MRSLLGITIATFIGGGLLLCILFQKDNVMNDGNSVFWLSALGTCLGMLMGGLLIFLCFRPLIDFAQTVKKEMDAGPKESKEQPE